jgi:hypothetical protein
MTVLCDEPGHDAARVEALEQFVVEVRDALYGVTSLDVPLDLAVSRALNRLRNIS